MNLYQEHIMDHYRSPRNRGILDEPSVIMTDSNPLCGDKISIQLKIENDRIVGARQETNGCAISQAGASMLFERLEGLSVHEALALDKQFILDEFGSELSVSRIKCALLALAATKKALIEKETYKAA